MAQYKLFTDSDLDGVSCGIIAKLVFGDNIDITYTAPKIIDVEIDKFLNEKEYKKYKKVFITDLSVSSVNARRIDSEVAEYIFKLLDHHSSAYFLQKYKWARVCEILGERKTCGTELFWEYLKETINEFYDLSVSRVNQYVNFVRLWDTWEWSTVNSEDSVIARKLSVLYGLYGIASFTENMTNRLSKITSRLIDDSDEHLISVIEDKKKRYVQTKAKGMKTINWNGYTVGVVFAEENISDLGNYLCKTNEIDFAAIINLDFSVVSLRATKDINLSEIARRYGGGGHPKSAGFNFDKDIKNLIISNILKNDNSHIEGI